MGILYATVASGGTVTGDVDLRKALLTGIMVPVINSADLGVQGNVDTTSALFTRLLDVRGQLGSGDLRFFTQAGSRMVPWPEAVPQPAYVRFETIMATGSAQTDNRTLTLATRPR